MMTDTISEIQDKVGRLFPYDHECNPTRLFEWIAKGWPVEYSTHLTATRTGVEHKFYMWENLEYIIPTDAPDEYTQHQFRVILRALKQQGYRHTLMLDNKVVGFRTDRPDWNPIEIWAPVDAEEKQAAI
jgi:hypothetical protein